MSRRAHYVRTAHAIMAWPRSTAGGETVRPLAGFGRLAEGERGGEEGGNTHRWQGRISCTLGQEAPSPERWSEMSLDST